MPKSLIEFTHRTGRTGRAGNLGVAITLIDNDIVSDRFVAKQLIEVDHAFGKLNFNFCSVHERHALGGAGNSAGNLPVKTNEGNWRICIHGQGHNDTSYFCIFNIIFLTLLNPFHTFFLPYEDLLYGFSRFTRALKPTHSLTALLKHYLILIKRFVQFCINFKNQIKCFCIAIVAGE